MLGSDDMELIVTHANNHLQSHLNQSTDAYVETVSIDFNTEPELKPEPELEPESSKQERLLDMPF